MAETSDAKRDRSSGYPRAPLSEAEAFVLEVAKAAGNSRSVSLAELLKALKLKSRTSDPFAARLSSARQYGFIAITSQTITLLENGVALQYGNEDEKRKVRIAAVERPKLYAMLIAKYSGKGLPSATDLGNQLARDRETYGVLPTKAQAAAQTFLESLEHAGLVRSGVLVGPAAVDSDADTAEDATGVPAADDGGGDEGRGASRAVPAPAPPAARPRHNSASLDFGDGRVAQIQLPADLASPEARRVRALVEALLPEGNGTADG